MRNENPKKKTIGFENYQGIKFLSLMKMSYVIHRVVLLVCITYKYVNCFTIDKERHTWKIHNCVHFIEQRCFVFDELDKWKKIR